MTSSMRRVMTLISLLISLDFSTQSSPSCALKDGTCTYNVHLSTPGSCVSGTDNVVSHGDNTPLEIGELRQQPDGATINRMQQDFNAVKDDHENRIKELESSIQKVLRNAISVGSVPSMNVASNLVDAKHDQTSRTHGGEKAAPERQGNLLLFQLQSQFNRLSKSLSERTADLLDARNKLNETLDLLTAAQKQALGASSKLAELETKSSVLERETNILKNKLKDKTERLDIATERLSTSETKLTSLETQLYDVVRAESNVREEFLTLKLTYNKTQADLSELTKNHTDVSSKYKKARRTLKLREDELMDCYSAKTQTFCGFEDPDMCGFQQDNETDDFDWLRHQSRTPSSATGPEYDHTCNGRYGHFMYIEASGKTKGNSAKMSTPGYRGLGAQCVEFFYHMYGRHVGTLTVHSKILAEDDAVTVWRVYGNQGNLWIKGSISISEETAIAGYQLIFEGTVDVGYEGDISIDDFRIREGACAIDVSSQEITPAPINQRERSRLLREQIERYRRILRQRQRQRSRGGRSDTAGDDDDADTGV